LKNNVHIATLIYKIIAHGRKDLAVKEVFVIDLGLNGYWRKFFYERSAFFRHSLVVFVAAAKCTT